MDGRRTPPFSVSRPIIHYRRHYSVARADGTVFDIPTFGWAMSLSTGREGGHRSGGKGKPRWTDVANTRVEALVERFDIEPYSDFSAK